jgi:hypothetical protein
VDLGFGVLVFDLEQRALRFERLAMDEQDAREISLAELV